MPVPKNFVAQPYAYHQEIELEIDTLTNLGNGLGRHEGWVVMVPFALPGERVKVRIFRNHKSWSDADLIEVLRPSPDRITPTCQHFGDCGGCQYQHLSYAAQLVWKQRQVKELFQRLAGVTLEVDPVHPSPETWAYRTKITPHFDRAPKPGQPFPFGFKKADNMRICDVLDCPITTPAINQAFQESRRRITAETAAGKSPFKRGATLLFRHTLEGVVTDHRAVVTERVGDLTLQFRAGEFFQNNPHVIPDLVEYAVAHAAASGARFLVDAYCGVGLFALAAARRFERVSGVEVNEDAIFHARANAKRNQRGNVTFLAGVAEAIFQGLTFPGADTAVILDPPRKGCDRVFLDQLFAFKPRRVVYVSCAPDTQARDLQAFVEAGWKPVAARPFDLFPHTRHVENVLVLDPPA